MTPTPQPIWTDERVSLLRELWGAGMSASDIAQQMGGISRSAVCGKLYRLRRLGRNMAGDATKHTKERAQRARAARQTRDMRSNVPVRAKRAKPVPPPPNLNPEPPAPKYIPKERVRDPLPGSNPVASIIDVTGCKFPVGEHPYHYCNEPKLEGKSWCAAHAEVVFERNPKTVKGTGTFKSLGEALQGALS